MRWNTVFQDSELAPLKRLEGGYMGPLSVTSGEWNIRVELTTTNKGTRHGVPSIHIIWYISKLALRSALTMVFFPRGHMFPNSFLSNTCLKFKFIMCLIYRWHKIDKPINIHQQIDKTQSHQLIDDYSQCQNYRTEPGVQKYGKIPYLCTPPGSDSARSREN